MLHTFWSIRFEKERQKEDFSLFVTSFIPLIVSKENLPKQDVLLLKQKVELVSLSVLKCQHLRTKWAPFLVHC